MTCAPFASPPVPDALHPPAAAGQEANARTDGALKSWHWTLIVGFVACAIALGFASRLIRDGDTHLHIAAGRWMIEHRTVPSVDPFSYTFLGKPWVPHEWLSEVIYAIAYGALGWGGVLAVTGLALFATFALLARALSRWLAPALPALMATLALIMFEAHILARPHMLAAPVMVWWMSSLILARDQSRGPPLVLLPVMTIWSNLHGSFLAGIGFSLMLGCEAVWESRSGGAVPRIARQWGLFTVAAALFALVSPNGIEVYLLPLKLMTMKFAMAWLNEWRGVDFGEFQPLEVWIMVALFGATMLGLKLPPSRIVMILLLLHMSLSHERNMDLLALLSPLLIAKPLAAHLRALGGTAGSRAMDGGLSPMPRRAVAATALAITAGFFAVVVIFDVTGFRPVGKVAPEAALDAVRRAGITGHVMNAYVLGGFLIFFRYPALHRWAGRQQPWRRFPEPLQEGDRPAIGRAGAALEGIRRHLDDLSAGRPSREIHRYHAGLVAALCRRVRGRAAAGPSQLIFTGGGTRIECEERDASTASRSPLPNRRHYRFDYVLWIDFGQPPPYPPGNLDPAANGSFFTLYRVVKQ